MATVDQDMINATKHHDGLVARSRLDELGLTERGRRTRVADSRLVLVAPSVYLLGGLPLTWPRRLRAAAMSTGGVVSHMAAGAHQGFDRVGPGAVEVTVGPRCHPTLYYGKVHRSRFLPVDDIDRSGPFPVTIPERTLLDVAPRLGPRRLKAVLDDACRQGLIDKDLLRWRLAERRARGVAGVRALDALLAQPGFEPVLDSWLERRAAAVIDASDLPPGRWQVWSAPDGHATRVDLAYDFAMLIVEFDGHGTHATRAERQADAERMARLTAHGYCVIRFTYDDVVERPDYLIDTIARHLALRAVS